MVKIPKETDSIVNLSGGFECLAALWYAKKKGYNPVCLALYNPNAKGKFADAELKAAQKQAEYFDVPLIVDDKSSLPQEKIIEVISCKQRIRACAGNRMDLSKRKFETAVSTHKICYNSNY